MKWVMAQDNEAKQRNKLCHHDAMRSGELVLANTNAELRPLAWPRRAAKTMYGISATSYRALEGEWQAQPSLEYISQRTDQSGARSATASGAWV